MDAAPEGDVYVKQVQHDGLWMAHLSHMVHSDTAQKRAAKATSSCYFIRVCELLFPLQQRPQLIKWDGFNIPSMTFYIPRHKEGIIYGFFCGFGNGLKQR